MRASVLLRGACLLALILVAFPAPAADDESIVFFKNGRALRVREVREDGDWLWLVVSEPKKPEPVARTGGKPEKPEDLVREMAVLADTVDRIEDARTRAPRSSGKGPVTANGVVRSPSSYDSSASRSFVVENQKPMSAEELAKRRATNTERVANTPSMRDGAGGLDPQASGQALQDIDLSKTVAGQAMNAPMRNAKVPRHLLDRARQLNEQRRAERERRQAEAARQAAEQATAQDAEQDDSGSNP